MNPETLDKFKMYAACAPFVLFVLAYVCFAVWGLASLGMPWRLLLVAAFFAWCVWGYQYLRKHVR